jgi:acyl-coenzyme A thioesterase PaaI-like protein
MTTPLLYRHPRLFRWALTWFPPYWGSGIRVVEVAPDFGRIVVEMRATKLNRNAIGTHLGGSLYAMCDPFYCLILAARLGPDYVVWDKAAHIEFVKPGRGTVRAVFDWSEAQLAALREQAESGTKLLPERSLAVTDSDGDVVATIHKTLYVRLKKQ